MKKSIVILALLLFFYQGFGQTFRGQAIYESKTNLKNSSIEIKGNGISDDQMKFIEQQMKKAFEKTFVLEFDATQSTYIEEQKLEQAPQAGMKIMAFSSNSNGILFKDIKTKTSINAVEGMDGINYLITEKLPIYQWQISADTKKIGNYNCMKATAILKVTDEQMKEYKDHQSKKTASSFIPFEEPTEKTITAWFTTDIPISSGPERYQGLPGLILELNFDNTTLLCSKIVVNPKDPLPIKKPMKGKEISEKEFETIMQKGMENMQMMNSRREDGQFQTIKISR